MPAPIHVMHVLGNLGVGGAEMGVLRLIHGLSEPNLRHSITIAGSDQTLLNTAAMDIPCHALGLDGRSYTAFGRMAMLFKRYKVHVVHVNNLALWPDAVLASRLSGCRCVETFHGVEDPRLRFSSTKKKLYKAAGLLSSRVTAVSEEARALLAALTGIDPRTVELIPNGVDTARYAPAPSKEAKRMLRQRKGLPPDGIVVGCVAALRPVKNHEGLLEAFAHAVSDLRTSVFLVLVGDGPLRADMERRARGLGLEHHVFFLGKRSDVDDLLRCFDLFVLNSHTEGLSYALLEAMASGLPVVATAVGAAVRLVQQGRQGFLVNSGDTVALAMTLRTLLENPAMLQPMGEEARKTVQSEYGIERMLQRYKALYQEVASRA